jgi:hypothetical protein
MKSGKYLVIFVLIFTAVITFLSCRKNVFLKKKHILTEEQKLYWYDNTAEINIYELKQARYGQIRKGNAVMVFVTEPFSPRYFAKADEHKSGNIPVLKKNFTKNFTTGIYPYSMMTSTFLPVDGSSSSVKITSSCQEWCGHTFVEMKNRGTLVFDVFSYFEGENKRSKVRNATPEDDIWSVIRLFPEKLPQGTLRMIPPMFYLRLQHKDTKAYKCIASILKTGATTEYSLFYPELDRKMKIIFENTFPYRILKWDEEYIDGFGQGAKKLTTSGNLLKSHKSAYWQQNSNDSEYLRDSLLLRQNY